MAACSSHSSLLRPQPLVSLSRRRKCGGFSSIRLGRVAARFRPEESDPVLRSALSAAWVRHHESLRPEPLFIDPYASGLLSPSYDENEFVDSTNFFSSNHYRLATKFIDEKLHHYLSNSDEFRQIILLSDGMDTRPYRLSWPRLSIIYEISPERIFKLANQRLKGIGAKTSRNCLLFQFPIESRNLLDVLCKNGFNGNRPSLWVLQGLPLENLTSLEELLNLISSLAIKGSIFFGEITIPSDWTKHDKKGEFIERRFLIHGFRVSLVDYSDVAGNPGFEDPGNEDLVLGVGNPGNGDPVLGSENSVLFLAEQLRMSDAQMEMWRGHYERMEEEADEDGFEEL
ncbi:hypothetical protein LUZ60_011232 [Juncus effusus]|nr:hypothetical protein LUZ60_011232 [Juncus effusus]